MRAYKKVKEAEEKLINANIEHFVPKHYVVRTYHGKKSKRLAPVIPDIIFVHGSQSQIVDFKKHYNSLQFVMERNCERKKYVIVSDKEMDNFIKVASKYEENIQYFLPSELNIKCPRNVKICSGIFNGVSGILTKINRKNTLVITIGEITAVSVELSDCLIKLENDINS